MSSFTRLLLEKGFADHGTSDGALPHRSASGQGRSYEVEFPNRRFEVPDLEKLLEELDQETEKNSVPSLQSHKDMDRLPCSEPSASSREVSSGRWSQESKPYRPLNFQNLAEGCPDLRQRCKEAFESVVKDSLHEDAQKPHREKPKPRKLPSQTPKSEHWNFSFNVNREVVGAELLELDEDGLPQPPTQDLRQLPRSKSRKAEALPGLPGLRPPNYRPEPGLARFRAIPQENEWIEGLKKMAEAQRPSPVTTGRKQSAEPVEEFMERGSPLEKRPLRCLRSAVVLSSVDCLCEDWK